MAEFHPLADDETRYPMPDDGKARVANTGKEIVAKDTTEPDCEAEAEGKPMLADSFAHRK